MKKFVASVFFLLLVGISQPSKATDWWYVVSGTSVMCAEINDYLAECSNGTVGNFFIVYDCNTGNLLYGSDPYLLLCSGNRVWSLETYPDNAVLDVGVISNDKSFVAFKNFMMLR